MTRDKLLSAARTLFLAQGYFATGTEDILRAAGVQRGSLYHHFADKAALLESVARQLQGEAMLKIADACADAGDRLLTGCLAWLDWLSGPGHARLLLRDVPAYIPERVDELAQSAFRGWLENLLLAEIEAGRFDIRARADTASRMIEGALAALAGTEQKAREELVGDLLGRFSRSGGNDYLKLLAAGRGAR